ncbi:hypothetical protein [Streptomyces qinglanensis]|uniref:Uncharacterized protein n=1 Tax=Streptomyces qinglanensis TaxID=943816 RepID=A0A1H9WTS0_9ACTN|nr:hypothetical protein [Streptomyces qinglanensis]SES37077.1 hypothetical protein SAMN05421870_12097 [Streptomyces qinglanensis]
MSTTPPPASAPSAHRRALITWLAVYPTITVALGVLGPPTANLPLPVRTLILTLIVVPVSAYALIPALLRMNARLGSTAAPSPAPRR